MRGLTAVEKVFEEVVGWALRVDMEKLLIDVIDLEGRVVNLIFAFEQPL